METMQVTKQQQLAKPRVTPARPLYTPEERIRRDTSVWTLVQGVLAPLQFLVFLLSLGLVLRFLATGEGLDAAKYSIVIKTLTLYAIMVTGAIWEREVFGVWLFAHSFFWEDVVSMGVIALHTAYVLALWTGWLCWTTGWLCDLTAGALRQRFALTNTPLPPAPRPPAAT